MQSVIPQLIRKCNTGIYLGLQIKFNAPNSTIKQSFTSPRNLSLVSPGPNCMSKLVMSRASVVRRFNNAIGRPTQLYGPARYKNKLATVNQDISASDVLPTNTKRHKGRFASNEFRLTVPSLGDEFVRFGVAKFRCLVVSISSHQKTTRRNSHLPITHCGQYTVISPGMCTPCTTIPSRGVFRGRTPRTGGKRRSASLITPFRCGRCAI